MNLDGLKDMSAKKIDTNTVLWNIAQTDFIIWINEQLGYIFNEDNKFQLILRLQKIVDYFQCETPDQFYSILYHPDKKYHQEITDMIVNNETYFFREEKFYNSLRNQIIPQFLQSGQKHMEIWSCACSTGQELYSTLMVLEELKPVFPNFSYNALGTDISQVAVSKAKSGIYSEVELNRGVTDSLKNRYFVSQNEQYKVQSKLIENVRFRTANAVERYSVHGLFNLIFCRNLLYYLNKDFKYKIIKNIHEHLYQGGLLVVSGAESLKDYSDLFVPTEMHGCYRRV